jgi:paired amphipathic helix protein Sin3a
MAKHERWQYYISSYIRVEPTEGVPRSRLERAVLARNLPKDEGDGDELSVPKPIAYDESLVVSICLNTSTMVYAAGTSEYFVYDKVPKDPEERARLESRVKRTRQASETRLAERMVLNNAWMKNRSQEEVMNANEAFHKWAKDGIIPGTASAGDAE